MIPASEPNDQTRELGLTSAKRSPRRQPRLAGPEFGDLPAYLVAFGLPYPACRTQRDVLCVMFSAWRSLRDVFCVMFSA